MSLPGVLRYSCNAKGCNNKYYNPVCIPGYVNKKLFQFPEKNLTRRRQWFNIMKLPESKTRKYLCEDHFEKCAFSNYSRGRLIKFAMPVNLNIENEKYPEIEECSKESWDVAIEEECAEEDRDSTPYEVLSTPPKTSILSKTEESRIMNMYNDMDRKKVYKIIPVEFDEIVDGAYVLNSPDGEQYKLTGENFPTKRGSLIRLDKNTFLRLMNDIEEDDLEEIVILNDEEEEDDTEIKQYGDLNVSINKEKEPATWPEEPTRNLIQMYKLLKPLVDKAEIKTMKQMWEKISDSLKKNGFNYDFHQVESKWKSLVRSYKVVSQQGSKRKSCLAGPFEKELGEILSKTKYRITSPEKDAESIDVPTGPSDRKKLKLDIEGIISNGTNLNSNTTEINATLCRIAKAIETETSKREKIEERKMEQRERLIQAIEKGNGLLIKLLLQK